MSSMYIKWLTFVKIIIISLLVSFFFTPDPTGVFFLMERGQVSSDL